MLLFPFSYSNSRRPGLGRSLTCIRWGCYSFQVLLAALTTAQLFLLLFPAQGLLETWLFWTPFWNTWASSRGSSNLPQDRVDLTLTYPSLQEDIPGALKHSNSELPLPWHVTFSVRVMTSFKRLKNAIRK